MYRNHNERFIILLVSLACIGLTIESLVMGWEFWVPPLIILGTVSLWVMCLTDTPEYRVRKIFYLAYAMLSIFYHGVHATSFFDVAIVVVLVLFAFSFMDQIYMMNLILIEYFIVMIMQYVMAVAGEGIVFDTLNISRVILHMTIVVLIYFSCIKSIGDRTEMAMADEEKEYRLESYDRDMEDFLSNISHELRTPVNVVNGMSELLLKRKAGQEVASIKDAGIRLAYQIEDIQDYTECKRGKIILEEDDYLSTSLINDVVMEFRLINENDLELIVDLDPMVPAVMRGDIKKLHKIFRHLLENAVKFTKAGGIYLHMYAEKKDYGVNLCIEMTDTGIGMSRVAMEAVTKGMYQVDKRRDRSSGGIGLGLFIVYGFAHRMGGFVKIESERKNGTTVRVTIPQKVVKDENCLELPGSFTGDIVFHTVPEKYKVPKVRDFYRAMATNLARGINAPLYSATTVKEIERLMEKLNVTYVFIGPEEYEASPDFFDDLSKGDVVVSISADQGFEPRSGSEVIVMPKPLYAYPVIKIRNEGKNAERIDYADNTERPEFNGVSALIVDDEPMNLVVAAGIFSDYGMVIDTAGGGKEAIIKFRNNDYDVVFMDHMMPEMDGVETMKQIKRIAAETGSSIPVIALTANAVSGAKEMFMKEGFDGFIAKPIYTPDFERVMLRELPKSKKGMGGKTS